MACTRPLAAARSAEPPCASPSPPRQGGNDDEAAAARLKSLDGALQAGLYLLQLAQSRHHEYEADRLALALGGAAGMDTRTLAGGAADVLRRFMALEGGGGGASAGADSPLSTHPAAANRLRRLVELPGGG